MEVACAYQGDVPPFLHSDMYDLWNAPSPLDPEDDIDSGLLHLLAPGYVARLVEPRKSSSTTAVTFLPLRAAQIKASMIFESLATR